MGAETLRPVTQTLLVVDDDPLMTELFRQFMTKRGFIVREAASAREALAIFAEESGRIQLVITDMTMPEMDGCALARELAARAPHVPVLIATGRDTEETRDWLPPNVVGVVQKPYQNRALEQRIREILDAAPGP